MPPNSPLTAGRIVGLALFANDEINDAELFALHRVQVCHQLGLSRECWQGLLAELHDAFLHARKRPRTTLADVLPVQYWLNTVDDPALQQRVAQMCAAVVSADGFVDPGEARLLRRLLGAWPLPAEDREMLEALVYGLDFEIRPRTDVDALH